MSWTRREFSAGMGAAAVSIHPLDGVPGLLPTLPARHKLVVFEPGIAASVAFAEACARRGATRFSLGTDIGTLWHGGLQDHIERGCPLTGLTLHASRFLAEILAKDHAFGFAVREKVLARHGRGEKSLYAWRVEKS